MLKQRLKDVGLTKKGLAELLGVSDKTVLRMGDEVTPEVEAVIEDYVNSQDHEPAVIPMAPKQKDWEDYSLDEIRELCKRRGGLEGLDSDEKRIAAKNCRMVEGGEVIALETDYEIAHSIGLRVFEFHRMVDKLRRAS